jgi:hypothetical protein
MSTPGTGVALGTTPFFTQATIRRRTPYPQSLCGSAEDPFQVGLLLKSNEPSQAGAGQELVLGHLDRSKACDAPR